LELQKSKRPIHFFWGLRAEKDLYCEEILADFKETYTNFNYQISLSQPTDQWQGLRGYCTQILAHNWHEIDNIAQADFYLCGSGDMLTDAKEFLQRQSIEITQVFHEKYY